MLSRSLKLPKSTSIVRNLVLKTPTHYRVLDEDSHRRIALKQRAGVKAVGDAIDGPMDVNSQSTSFILPQTLSTRKKAFSG